MLISNWQAANVVQEVATGADKTWDGWSDWLDRLGVVGSVVGLLGAGFKSSTLFKNANKVMNVERTMAAAGAKNSIVTAEATKILTNVANKQRLQAVGVVAGELTGINTALDLTKLVSMNAVKVLPDSITTAAHDLQKVIREPVQKLIDELLGLESGCSYGMGGSASIQSIEKNIFGHEEENIENNINWWKLHLHPDDALKVELSLGAAISSDKDFWIEEYKFLTNDGKYASVLDRAYIIRNENGKAIKMIGGMQDISDLKKIEQKLLEKNRKLSEIAFFNSHKLRAPLARIIGLVSTFDLEEEIFSETTKDTIKKLVDSTKELDQMVKEMGKLTNI
jgi:PAS domain S-box-containing protein